LELCRQLADGGVYNSVYAICRKTSEELTKLAAGSGEKVKIVENIEITKDDAASAVQKAFATNEASPTPIHLLVHNAGAYGPPENFSGPQDVYNSQALQNINAEKMRFTFELNTVAPLVLTQALLPNIMAASKEGDPAKVAIVTSAMGSIAENGSGGHYAYRAAKAAVNMVGKSLAVDLKDKNIAVGLSK
jgi:NAD(P)-dependent dehydrogenase (short-subunit alcohol dehydrogenase family)